MSKPLTIVARIKAKKGFEAQVEMALKALIKPTLAEKGCIQYDLHRSLETSGLFLFYENWETMEDWQAHMESPHLKTTLDLAKNFTEDLAVFQMEKID